MTTSVLDKSAYFTYLKVGNIWMSVPGEIGGFGQFRVYMHSGSTIIWPEVVIRRVTAGSAMTAQATRIIFIPANDIRNDRQTAVNFNDYEAVKKYYNLPD